MVAHQNSPGKNTGLGCHFLLQGIFETQGLNLGLLHCRQILYHLSHQGSPSESVSHSVVHATPWTAAHQAPLSKEFFRREYWSGLPFPSPENPLSMCYYQSYFLDKSAKTYTHKKTLVPKATGLAPSRVQS